MPAILPRPADHNLSKSLGAGRTLWQSAASAPKALLGRPGPGIVDRTASSGASRSTWFLCSPFSSAENRGLRRASFKPPKFSGRTAAGTEKLRSRGLTRIFGKRSVEPLKGLVERFLGPEARHRSFAEYGLPSRARGAQSRRARGRRVSCELCRTMLGGPGYVEADALVARNHFLAWSQIAPERCGAAYGRNFARDSSSIENCCAPPTPRICRRGERGFGPKYLLAFVAWK